LVLELTHGSERTKFIFGLDCPTYRFTVEERSYTEPFSGVILKYAIEGLLNTAS